MSNGKELLSNSSANATGGLGCGIYYRHVLFFTAWHTFCPAEYNAKKNGSGESNDSFL